MNARNHLPVEQKNALVAKMLAIDKGQRKTMAAQLATQFGISPKTVLKWTYAAQRSNTVKMPRVSNVRYVTNTDRFNTSEVPDWLHEMAKNHMPDGADYIPVSYMKKVLCDLYEEVQTRHVIPQDETFLDLAIDSQIVRDSLEGIDLEVVGSNGTVTIGGLISALVSEVSEFQSMADAVTGLVDNLTAEKEALIKTIQILASSK